ncbi:MAG: anti-sigma F factor [Oscillospiraceae bacterium]|nr:anti-sigma F factor [Oscillospiraceae bacterium]
MLNEFKMSFKSDSRNESLARVAVTAFLSQLDPPVSELTEIKTAVSEAVTNSIVHGYRYEEGKVELSVRVSDNSIVYIKVKDSGCGISDIEKAMEPLYTSAPEEERAGLGFAVMESFMDKIKVTSRAGRGTTVTMQRKISC